jgi:hypothetical protein
MSSERELLEQALEICLLVGSLDLAREIKAALARPEADPVGYADPDTLEEVSEQVGRKGFVSVPTHITNTPVNGKVAIYTSPRPYNALPNHPMFDAFIRAFWRRIHAYKNDFEKELPEEMPVQLRASMETALLVFDKDNAHPDPMTVIDIADDDALRFVQRVLESDSPESDRLAAREMITGIRTRVRAISKPERKPLTKEEIEQEHDRSGRDQSNVGLAEFISGVRFAEIRHGIWNKE